MYICKCLNTYCVFFLPKGQIYKDKDWLGVFNVDRSCSVNAILTLLRSCEGVINLAGMYSSPKT